MTLRSGYADGSDRSANAAHLDIVAFIEGAVDHDHQATCEITQRVLKGEGQKERGPSDHREKWRDVHAKRGQNEQQSHSDYEPESSPYEERFQYF